jgi:hypothetical protein
VDYGKNDNAHLLLHYGFTLKDNEMSMQPLYIFYDNETIKLNKPFQVNYDKDDLKEFFEDKLKRFSTTLEQDIKELNSLDENDTLNFNKINILRVLIEEKKVITCINAS